MYVKKEVALIEDGEMVAWEVELREVMKVSKEVDTVETVETIEWI